MYSRQHSSEKPQFLKRWVKWFSVATALNAVLFALVLSVATPFYETNDDRAMQMIASGMYTGHPSEYLVFTSVLIGWVLRLAYEFAGGVNWYLFYLLAVHFLALTGIAFVVLNRRSTWSFVLAYLAFFFVVELRILLQPQFTTTAFLAATSGLLLFADGAECAGRISWPKVVSGMALFSLALLIRQEVLVLLLVIAAPFLIERFGAAGWRRLVFLGGLCAGLFLVLSFVNRSYYDRDPEWAEFMEYNRLRGGIHGTALVRSLPEAAAEIGWSTNDAEMFADFYYADPEVYGSVDKMKALSHSLHEMSHTRFSLLEGLSLKHLYLPKLFQRNSALLMEIAMLVSLWCICMAPVRPARYAITSLVTCLILEGLSVWLLQSARLPDRVTYNMPLFIIAMCLYWYSGFASLRPEGHSSYCVGRWFPSLSSPGCLQFLGRRLAGVFIMLSVILYYQMAEGMWYADGAHRKLKEISKIVSEPLLRLQPAHGRLVLIPMPFDSRLEQCMYFANSGEVSFSFLPYGWPTHSPIFKQVLENLQLHPYSMTILGRDDVFFVMEERWLSRLSTFYREHYGVEVRFELVLNTDKMPRYWECGLQVYQARIMNRFAATQPVPAHPLPDYL